MVDDDRNINKRENINGIFTIGFKAYYCPMYMDGMQIFY
jgi:hypothetical protein